MLNDKNLENKRFGKGLSSLLGEKNLSIISQNNKNEIDVNSIIINDKQPRKNFNEDSLKELVESIKQYGILQPIIVREKGEKYEIIAGERRYRSAKIAGLTTIPAIIKEFNDQDSFSLSIIENIQRENLNVLEEANAYKELIEKYNYTQQEISEKVSKSRSHIANLLRLLNLPEIVQKHLIDGKIEMGHARALINYEFAEEIIDYIIENNLTVRDVEKIVKDEKNITFLNKVNKIKKKYVDDDIKSKVLILEKKIKLKCNINYNEKSNKYVLNIKFNSDEELDNFINNF